MTCDLGTDAHALASFRAYLRIKTVHPHPDYESAVSFLCSLASDFGLGYITHEFIQGKPVVIVSLVGACPELPSILLNSHMDVVPVTESKWKWDPFAADMDEGNIYARGAQDMKSVGMQHLFAVGRLALSGVRFARTVHVSFVPDEEIGGLDGMKCLVESAAFAFLNVGFALDEGLANPGPGFIAYYGERAVSWITAEANGIEGHGSLLVADTALDRLLHFLNHFVNWRDSELMRLTASQGQLALGDVTTININMIQSGAFSSDMKHWQTNVIPGCAKAAIDVRLTPSFDPLCFERQIETWASLHDIKLTYSKPPAHNPVTDTNTETSVWWRALVSTANDMQIPLEKRIFPAASDGRYLRQKGIPVIGLSPMNHTPVLLHEHDEFLNAHVFLSGIGFFENLFHNLLSVQVPLL